MAAGVPVVATLSEGAREILEDGQTGRLISIGDIEATARSISELMSDTQASERLKANAERAVRERFSLERMVDATEDLYRKVLNQNPRRGAMPADDREMSVP
jgi:glycosyltransferase involved in cell wall biosynthesis